MMPELGRTTVDKKALALIREWIAAMPPVAPVGGRSLRPNSFTQTQPDRQTAVTESGDRGRAAGTSCGQRNGPPP